MPSTWHPRVVRGLMAPVTTEKLGSMYQTNWSTKYKPSKVFYAESLGPNNFGNTIYASVYGEPTSQSYKKGLDKSCDKEPVETLKFQDPQTFC